MPSKRQIYLRCLLYALIFGVVLGGLVLAICLSLFKVPPREDDMAQGFITVAFTFIAGMGGNLIGSTIKGYRYVSEYTPNLRKRYMAISIGASIAYFVLGLILLLSPLSLLSLLHFLIVPLMTLIIINGVTKGRVKQ